MLLQKDDYDEFIKIYKQVYGKTITMEEAISMGDNLIRFIRSIQKCALKEYHNSHVRNDP